MLADLPSVATAPRVRPTTRIWTWRATALRGDRLTQGDRSTWIWTHFLLRAHRPLWRPKTAAFTFTPGFDPLAILRRLAEPTPTAIVNGASTLTSNSCAFFSSTNRNATSRPCAVRSARPISPGVLSSNIPNWLLALYINQSYYGNFAIGLEAAAYTFFAKPAAQAGRAECPSGRPGPVSHRLQPAGQSRCSQGTPTDGPAPRMRNAKLPLEVRRARADPRQAPLRFRSSLFQINAPHFVMYVQDLAQGTWPRRLAAASCA